jgi:hypothetical protein
MFVMANISQDISFDLYFVGQILECCFLFCWTNFRVLFFMSSQSDEIVPRNKVLTESIRKLDLQQIVIIIILI